MANRFVGDYEFSVGDQKYIMSFSFNALAELEDAIGIPVNEVFGKMGAQQLTLSQTRKVFWAGLLDHQPDTSQDDAKQILSQLRAEEVGSIIGEALTRSVGRSEEGGHAGPPKAPATEPAAAGTG